MTNGADNTGRGSFGRLGFILAAAGSAVGLGNLWKFPYIAFDNQGGAFVLVYLVAVVLVGIPIMMAEVLMGRRTRRNPVGCFQKLAAGTPGGRAWTGVGILGVLTGFIILSYYSVVAGWTIRYILLAVSGNLAELAHDPARRGGFFGDFLGDGGQQVLYHGLFMAATTGVVVFGVKQGIERAAKILMPILMLILVGLTVYALTTGGSAAALHFLFRPNFTELKSEGVLEAVGHSFFTLSLGMGAMLTYGSYMQKQASIAKASVVISILDTVIALMACVIMYSILFTAYGTQEQIQGNIGSSATILFTTLPTVFYQMPGGGVISAFFYLLVAFAALSSTVSLLEVVSSYAIDQFGWKRRNATLTVAAVIFVFGVLSALSLGGQADLSTFDPIGKTVELPGGDVKNATEGVFSTLDYLASNWCLPVGGLLIALFVGWFMNSRDTRDELDPEGREGDTNGWYDFWLFTIRFVAPAAVAAIIVSVVLGRAYN